MNPIFKCNGKAKYSAKNFKGGYTSNNVQVCHVKLNKKRRLSKTRLLNIFKDYQIVAKSSPKMFGYDECID